MISHRVRGHAHLTWDRGGTGTLTVRWRADQVADLTITFG